MLVIKCKHKSQTNVLKIWQVSAFTRKSSLITKYVKKLGMTHRPKKKRVKHNAWLYKVLPTRRIPFRSTLFNSYNILQFRRRFPKSQNITNFK